MKRFITLIIVFFVFVLISGCSIIRGAISRARQAAGSPPATVTSTPCLTASANETLQPSNAPVVPQAMPTKAESTDTPAVNEYTSATLGIMFSMPESWSGKFRVDEGEGYLGVYFFPEEPIDETMGEGKLFTIIVKESEDDAGFFDNEREIEINGIKYLCGMPTDVSYSENQPEYETYTAMMKDVPSVLETIRAADDH